MRYTLPETRLCKQIFQDMEDDYFGSSTHPWPYFQQLNKIMVNAGIGEAMLNVNSDWFKHFCKLQLESYKIDFFPGD